MTGAGWSLRDLAGSNSIALFYLMAVVVAGLRLSRWPVLGIAVSGALLWNFLFIPPYFTLNIRDFHDFMMFGTLLLVALVLGHLTTRLKQREKNEFLRERRTATLLSLTEVLASQPEIQEALRQVLRMIETFFNAEVCLLTRKNGESLKELAIVGSTFEPDERERGVAAWSYHNRKPAGRFTDTLGFAQNLHLPLYTSALNLGVLLIRPRETRSFDVSERSLLENFAAQLGFALQKEHVIEAMRQAEIADRSSQLQKTLLDSVSHELKTPLVALGISAEALQEKLTEENPHRVRVLALEIKTATARLNRIVNHLIEITRIESGAIQPKLEWFDPQEMVFELKEQLKETFPHRHFTADLSSISLIKSDPVLLGKALLNLLSNAMTYAPEASQILLSAQLNAQTLQLQVRDHGPGIRPEDLVKIFDKFYRGNQTTAGGSGLGLSISLGFVKALGGEIRVTNALEGGALFELTIPVESKMIPTSTPGVSL